MEPYLDVVRRVLEGGARKTSRTGVDTWSAFNINYEIDLRHGFPLLTTKAMSWKNIVVENLWFLSGQRDIGLLRRHGCKFWEPWADEQGLVPSAYGSFWRSFPAVDPNGLATTFDQVRWVLDELHTNPDSRRLVISAWAPGHAQQSALPPCHAFLVFNVQRDQSGEPSLCLHVTQRSCDIALGLPYNIAGYALILALFAQLAGIPPGRFAHTLIDAHIYIDKADGSMAEYDHRPGLNRQLERSPRPRPRLELAPDLKTLDDVLALTSVDTETLLGAFRLHDYDPHPAIAYKVAV